MRILILELRVCRVQLPKLQNATEWVFYRTRVTSQYVLFAFSLLHRCYNFYHICTKCLSREPKKMLILIIATLLGVFEKEAQMLGAL